MALHVYKSCRGLTMKNRRNVEWVEEKGEKEKRMGPGRGVPCVSLRGIINPANNVPVRL